MAQPSPQDLRTHARYVPLYHFGLGLVILVLLGWTVGEVIAHPSRRAALDLLIVAALTLAAFYARAFALTAQDRVIRLEMNLRMQRLAPDLMPRFAQFAPAQLTALRFAGDAELPALAQRVLDGTLSRSADIKRQIRDWQADHLRV